MGHRIKREKAFTLAEVLITLAIIGVVAAILIPSFMQKVQDWQFKQAAKDVYSKCSQIIQQMRIDEGGKLPTYGPEAEVWSGNFKQEFIKYFKVIKDCDQSACVPGSYESDVYKSLSGDKASTHSGGEGQFVTVDGVFFNIQNSIYGSVYIIFDVNGYLAPPNVYGKDTFAAQIIGDKLVPMGGPGTTYLASSSCKRNISINTQGLGCLYNVMLGIDY